MSTTINFNREGFELFMELLPSVAAIFELGFIPMLEEIRELDEDAYAAYEQRNGSFERPLFTFAPLDESLLQNKVISIMFPDEVPKLYKGIEFFRKYAATHKIPFADRRRVFDHAFKNAPQVIKNLNLANPPKNSASEGEVYDKVMDFLAAGVDLDSVFTLDVKNSDGVQFSKSFIPAYAKNVPSEVMPYEDFKQYAIDALSKIYTSDKYRVEASMSLRSTEEQHEAIHVVDRQKDVEWSNGFLVEPYYEEYKLGKPLGEIVLDMLKLIEGNEEWMSKVNASDLTDFETAKSSLFVRLLRYETNKSALVGNVHKIFEDMAIVAYMLVNKDESGISSYKINVEIVEKWNLSEEFVLDFAVENTAKLFRPYMIPIEMYKINKETVHTIPDENRFFMEPDFKLNLSLSGVYSLFQDDGLNDATIIFYKDAMKRIAEILNDDLYVIAPQIDYAVVHAKKKLPAKQLKKIFKRIKSNASGKEGMLSELIFCYKRDEDKLTVLWE